MEHQDYPKWIFQQDGTKQLVRDPAELGRIVETGRWGESLKGPFDLQGPPSTPESPPKRKRGRPRKIVE